MHAPAVIRRWLGGCGCLLIAAALASAQHPDGPNPCPPPCCPPARVACPPPRVIVHTQPPEVVYEEDDCATGCVRERSHRSCFARHCRKGSQAVTNTMTVASAAAPMSLGVFSVTPNVVTQGFAAPFNIQASGCQTNGIHAADFAELRTAQELELMSARLATLQATREAELRVFNASMQRVQAQIASALPAGLKQTAGTQSVAETTSTGLSKALEERLDRLERKIDSVAALCAKIYAEQPKPPEPPKPPKE